MTFKLLALLSINLSQTVAGTVGISNVAIWNGNIVKNFQDYPYLTSIQIKKASAPWTNTYDDTDASGTFISSNFILTAGHVVTDQSGGVISPDNMDSSYGGLNLKTDKFTTFNIKKIYRFPGFIYSQKDRILDGDLALLEIDNHPSVKVQTVDLLGAGDPKNLVDPGIQATTIGWGFSYLFEQGVSPELRYGNSVIQANDLTDYYLKTLSEDQKLLFDHQTMIPTYSSKAQNATAGDSGGPIVTFNPRTKRNVEIGLTSWGPNNEWSFYTKLTNPDYLAWINSIVKK